MTIQGACFIVLIVDGLARQIIDVIVVLLLNNLTLLARSIGVLENMHFEWLRVYITLPLMLLTDQDSP